MMDYESFQDFER